MTDFESMFHEGQRALQDRFDGRRVADALEKHRRLEAFNKKMTSMIESATFFFLATAHGESVDCSFKGGPRGFVRVTGPKTRTNRTTLHKIWQESYPVPGQWSG